ncbi:MAG TPA: tetratricopeptide repeat protein, partial [Verrucomicrobiae bacterium]|nr:tetratricopeptide repeat protein [Verrucomicrobiae bacterium]
AVTLMALLTGYIRFRTGVFWFRSRPWAWVVAVVLLLSGTAFLGTQGVRQYREARWLARARQLPLSSPAQIEALKRAFQIDPKNGATAYALGEAFRHLAKEGGSHYEGETGGDYAAMARQGEEWFERAVQLNRFDGNAWLGLGWCLDWLGKTKKAAECFARAEALDPNGYYAMFRIGQHYIQNGDFSAAKPWFERSIRLEGDGVRTAGGYLQVANTRMMEYATNDIAARLSQALSRARPE